MTLTLGVLLWLLVAVFCWAVVAGGREEEER